MLEALKNEILSVNPSNFEELALKIFRFQAEKCKPYCSYLHHLGIRINNVNCIEKIPFLPISFFKTQQVIIEGITPSIIFESSGTTGKNTSRHYLSTASFYDNISVNIFQKIYGELQNYHIIAILPNYFERGNSSLIHMVSQFIEKTNSPFSGFYLNDIQAIINILKEIALHDKNRKIIIWGVTFALLEIVQQQLDFSFVKEKLIVLETGGMKGRHKEMVRDELYTMLKNGFLVNEIHSEYGMTELLSQAYSTNDAIFQCPDSMKVLIRDTNDPFFIYPTNTQKSGGINIIDLANVESCSFIETQDLGQYGEQKGTFKVLGRFDNSDLRGCNLLIN